MFTLFDVTWSAAQLLSLAVGAALVDVIGMCLVYWTGGSLLVVAGVIRSALLGQYDFRAMIEHEHEGEATVAGHSVLKTLRLALTTGRIR